MRSVTPDSRQAGWPPGVTTLRRCSPAASTASAPTHRIPAGTVPGRHSHPASVVVIAVNDPQAATIVLIALPLIPIFAGADGDHRRAIVDRVGGDDDTAGPAARSDHRYPDLRALGRAGAPADRIDTLRRRSSPIGYGDLRIAFLSALALELIATLRWHWSRSASACDRYSVKSHWRLA